MQPFLMTVLKLILETPIVMALRMSSSGNTRAAMQDQRDAGPLLDLHQQVEPQLRLALVDSMGIADCRGQAIDAGFLHEPFTLDGIRETEHVALRALRAVGRLADHADLPFHRHPAGMGGGNDPLRDGDIFFQRGADPSYMTEVNP